MLQSTHALKLTIKFFYCKVVNKETFMANFNACDHGKMYKNIIYNFQYILHITSIKLYYQQFYCLGVYNETFKSILKCL